MRRILNQTNWNDTDFQKEKACSCSYFSQQAYEAITECELIQHKEGRTNIFSVPSLTYHGLLEDFKIKSQNDSFNRVIQNLNHDLVEQIRDDLNNIQIVASEYTVILMVRIIMPRENQQVIIVAIRGTQGFFNGGFLDWKTNFTAFKKRIFTVNNSNIKLHRGYFNAAKASYNQIGQGLHQMKADANTPIYLTGHSLGGATAAILNVLWNECAIRKQYINHTTIPNPVKSCYTFGMPHYGDFNAVQINSQYHVLNM